MTTIERVDSQILRGFPLLTFEPALERAYEDDNLSQRRTYLRACGIIGIIVCNLFLITDWQMIPDLFVKACVDRLGIFSPLVGVQMVLMHRSTSRVLREGAWSAILVLSTVLLAGTVLESRSPDHLSYRYGTVLIMIFGTMVQRPPFAYALITNFCMMVVQVAALMRMADLSERVRTFDLIFYASATILLLSAAYALEREHRRGYLLSVRSRLLNEQLDLNAQIDPLTGLWNRRHLKAAMILAWARAVRSPMSMAIVLIDIDHFKSFNDAYGHLEGDECLQRVADCLKRTLRGGRGVAVRFGGEEFMVYIPEADACAARAIADDVRLAIRTEAIAHPVRGPGAIVTASFGIAAGLAPGASAADLMAAADAALYRAKSDGRDYIRSSAGDLGAATPCPLEADRV